LGDRFTWKIVRTVTVHRVIKNKPQINGNRKSSIYEADVLHNLIILNVATAVFYIAYEAETSKTVYITYSVIIPI
jgi:hypothetical protein